MNLFNYCEHAMNNTPQPIMPIADTTNTDAIPSPWEDWFEASYQPFSIQACVEEQLLQNAVFVRLQPLLQQRLMQLLQAITEITLGENLLTVHGLTANPPAETLWEWEWMLSTNSSIQAWNVEHRQKDSPTDVLSFPTFGSEQLTPEADPMMLAFYEAQKQQGGSLGTIVVSWEYAQQAIAATSADDDTLINYVLERFCHGCLHLLGVHHETQAAYERVVVLQANALERVKQL
jgi:rRNA maturation RNase YbeY